MKSDLYLPPDQVSNVVLDKQVKTPQNLSGRSAGRSRDEAKKEVLIDWFDCQSMVTTDLKRIKKYTNLAYNLVTCGKNITHNKCSKNHHRLSRIRCMNEFCPDCGKKDSGLHRRRIRRAKDRLLWRPTLGYAVFTLPRDLSNALLPGKTITKLTKKTWQLVKKYFDTPGACVYPHYMGDKKEGFHLHFNVLFPLSITRGLVSQKVLTAMRNKWTAFINKEFNLTLDETDVHYDFAPTLIEQAHRIKYVFRPIVTMNRFLSLSDEQRLYYVGLRGRHNVRWYGKLANNVWRKYFESMNIEIPEDEEKTCPVCKEPWEHQGIFTAHKIHDNIFIDESGEEVYLHQIDDNIWIDVLSYNILKVLKNSPGFQT